jgi:hypothetical protein
LPTSGVLVIAKPKVGTISARNIPTKPDPLLPVPFNWLGSILPQAATVGLALKTAVVTLTRNL